MNVTVHHGDCLAKIAREHGVSLKAVIAANPQIKNPSLIYAGNIVHIPGDGFEKPKPKPMPPITGGGGTGHWQKQALEHPNAFFKQQFKSRFNPDGPPKSKDCGPTSVAMAVKAFGLEPPGLSVEESIDRVRKLMTGNTDNVATSSAEQARGARAAHLNAEHVSLRDLDEQLALGHMVVAVGQPNDEKGKAYASQFKRYPKFEGNHAILIVGKTADGKYVVNDPCSRTGSVELTPAQMHAYWAGGGGYGTAVWR